MVGQRHDEQPASCPIESVLESRFILLLDYLTTCSHNTLHRNICEPQERRMEWMPKRLLVTTAVAAALALPALAGLAQAADLASAVARDRKSTRRNSSHVK